MSDQPPPPWGPPPQPSGGEPPGSGQPPWPSSGQRPPTPPPGPPGQPPGPLGQPLGPPGQPPPVQTPFPSSSPGPYPAGPPPGAGWYSGPFPLPGLVRQDGFWRSLGRTAAKCVVALVTLGVGGIVLLAVLAGGLAAIAGLAGSDGDEAPQSLSTDFVEGDQGNGNVLLAVPVTGTILGESEGGGDLFGAVDATYGYEISEKLARAAERTDIDGVVLEMDTPGGTIFGSRAIADAVAEYRERTGNPVVAYVRGISASGGMLAMSGADRIVADHGTLVGSIGVIFGPLTFYDRVVAVDGGLLGGGVETTGGISVEYLTAGRGKDVGNPFRRLTDEERATLQQGVDRAYQGFVDTVAAGRDLPRERIVTELGALVFDEQTARDKGLVDEVGNRERAYAAAAELAGLAPGNFQVRRLDLEGGGLLSALTGQGGSEAGPGAAATEANSNTRASRQPCLRGPQLLALMGTALPLCGS